MRSIAFSLLLVFSVLCASCATERRPLPPPGPPIPVPPPPAAAPSPPQAVRAPHAGLAGKQFAVLLLRAEADRREIDGGSAVRVVNTLVQNGIAARKATSVPGELPAKLLDAAKASSEAYSKSGGVADVFLYGEIAPGKQFQVRIAAVDLRSGKVIDDFGNQGPPELLDRTLHLTLEQTLTSVEAYFNAPPPPPPPPGK